jgi:hypothetical protein
MITFHRHEDGSLLSAITGELFGHQCDFGGRTLWVNDDGVRTLFARVVLPASSPPRILRLKVEKGALKAARDVKPTDKMPESVVGQAVWPLPNEIGKIGETPGIPASEPAETRAAAAFEPVALIEFAGHNYEIDAASLAARVTALEASLREALAEFDDALGYVEEQFVTKWRYRETLARLRGVAGAPSGGAAETVNSGEKR